MIMKNIRDKLALYYWRAYENEYLTDRRADNDEECNCTIGIVTFDEETARRNVLEHLEKVSLKCESCKVLEACNPKELAIAWKEFVSKRQPFKLLLPDTEAFFI